MKLGFIGVGIIATHIVEGFCGLDKPREIFLSPRNAKNAAALAAKHGNVTVCASNQEVIDKSDTIFTCLLPKDCVKTLSELNFKPSHDIVNVAAVSIDEIKAAVGETKSLSHIVPLPFISSRFGPIAAYPESDQLRELLSPVGDAVFFKSQRDMAAVQAATSLMSAFYELLHNIAAFMEREGLGQAESVSYLTSFFGGLCRRASEWSEGPLHDLALEMTPGGLNELALNALTESGAIKAWAEVMRPVMKRLK